MPSVCFQCLGQHTTQQHALVLRDADSVRRGVRDLSESLRRSEDLTEQRVGEIADRISQDFRSSTESIVEAVSDAAERTIDALIWTHQEAMRLAHEQLSVLTGIAEMARNPRATQADELIRIGSDSLQRRRPADARRVLIDAIDLNPGDYRAYMALGHACVEMDEAGEGLQAFESAVAYARNDQLAVAALRRVARAAAALGDLQQALDAIATAIRIDPSHAEVGYEHVVYSTAASLSGTAVGTALPTRSWEQSLRRAIASDPEIYRRASEDPTLAYSRREIQEVLRAISNAAVEDARQALEQVLSDAEALVHLGLADADRVRRDAATAHAEVRPSDFYAALRGTATAHRLRESLDKSVFAVVRTLASSLGEATRLSGAHAGVERRTLRRLRSRAGEIASALSAYAAEPAPLASQAAVEWPRRMMSTDLVAAEELARELPSLAEAIDQEAAKGSDASFGRTLAGAIVALIPLSWFVVASWIAQIGWVGSSHLATSNADLAAGLSAIPWGFTLLQGVASSDVPVVTIAWSAASWVLPSVWLRYSGSVRTGWDGGGIILLLLVPGLSAVACVWRVSQDVAALANVRRQSGTQAPRIGDPAFAPVVAVILTTILLARGSGVSTWILDTYLFMNSWRESQFTQLEFGTNQLRLDRDEWVGFELPSGAFGFRYTVPAGIVLEVCDGPGARFRQDGCYHWYGTDLTDRSSRQYPHLERFLVRSSSSVVVSFTLLEDRR